MSHTASFNIARINISTGGVEDRWVNIGSDSVQDLVTDSTSIYILRAGYHSYIDIYSFAGAFVNTISLTGTGFSKIKVYNLNFYLINGSSVYIYSSAWSLISTFTASSSINALAVKDSNIYAILASTVEVYNSSGVLQSSFPIAVSVSDCIII